MYYTDILFEHYGWEGVALTVAILYLFAIQIYYYMVCYRRIAKYKNNRRAAILQSEPPLSVIIPMFSEDYTFIEERLPLIVGQDYRDFEVVVVYVGCNSDFFDDILRLRQSYPQVVFTKLNPRYPILIKMALNVGIKSAHNEHLVFSSTDAYPDSNRWLSLMAKGFTRGGIVFGYCGIERSKGLANYIMRTSRLTFATQWLASAVSGAPYRGLRSNMGITKSIYFDAKGFNCLNMNIGEDDLFIQKVATPENVSIIISPRATLREKTWGGLQWWTNRLRFFGSAYKFYPLWVKNFNQWELGSRLLFFLCAICAIAFMPLEYKIAVAAIVLLRYCLVLLSVNKTCNRLGERAICQYYFIHDLFAPIYAIYISAKLLRKDERVWR